MNWWQACLWVVLTQCVTQSSSLTGSREEPGNQTRPFPRSFWQPLFVPLPFYTSLNFHSCIFLSLLESIIFHSRPVEKLPSLSSRGADTSYCCRTYTEPTPARGLWLLASTHFLHAPALLVVEMKEPTSLELVTFHNQSLDRENFETRKTTECVKGRS